MSVNLYRLFSVIVVIVLFLGGGFLLFVPRGGVVLAQGSGPSNGSPDVSAPAQTLEDAQEAVIQIEAVGTFMDPEEGSAVTSAGRGSGFIIDESGIAVTNNHVVAGGALYRVYVNGETEPRSARVLGVSECADLAVIDIQGSGYPYLSWYTDTIKVGLDVFAAGFPLGDPEYTLTRGIISKARARGETSWSSMPQVLEHDALINPGNSGGPLLTREAQVVGVNYRRNNADQYFAIGRDEALPIIEQLRRGEDVDSIGINGEAVQLSDELTGIWVSSVQSGSVADQAGILPGDIVLSMEKIPLATDGTLRTYCEILRSHDPDDVMSISVMRMQTEEVLNGQLNGRALEPEFSFAESRETAQPNRTPTPLPGQEQDVVEGRPPYAEFVTISDELGQISVDVPAEWAQVEEGIWGGAEDPLGVELWAAPDVAYFKNNWDMSGLIFYFSQSLAAEYTPEELLDNVDYSEACKTVERSALPEGTLHGAYDWWGGCGETDSSVLIMSLAPRDQSYIVRIEIYTLDDADVNAADRILDSFNISLPNQSANLLLGPDVALLDATAVNGLGFGHTYSEMIEEPLVAFVPDTWTSVTTDDWLNSDDELIGAILTIRPPGRITTRNQWTTPSLTVSTVWDVSPDLDVTGLLDSIDYSDECTYVERSAYSHEILGIAYQGAYDQWQNCGGQENVQFVLAAASEPADHALFLELLATSPEDVEAFSVLAASFYVETPALAEIINQSRSRMVAAGGEAYVTFTDAEEAFSLALPENWLDTFNDDFVIEDEVVGRYVQASPDLQAFDSTWDTPGIYVAVAPGLAGQATPDEFLDVFDYSDDCTYDDRYPYANERYEGGWDVWNGCGGQEGNVTIVFVATPVDGEENLVLVLGQLSSDEDLSHFDQVLGSLTFGANAGPVAVSNPTATVIVQGLNVRTGPGTGYSRITTARRGDQFSILGQHNNCAWLSVSNEAGITGWVSGSSQYVSLNVGCDKISVAAPPASATPARPATGSGQSGRPAQPATTAQGCYTFQNNLGAELNVTFTNQDSRWTNTFKVAARGEKKECFDPGRYTYTLDAPPPWGSTNGELQVESGDNYNFPVNPG